MYTYLSFLLYQNEWSRIFSNIVSKAQNLGVILKGQQENPDGVLQVVFKRLDQNSEILVLI